MIHLYLKWGPARHLVFVAQSARLAGRGPAHEDPWYFVGGNPLAGVEYSPALGLLCLTILQTYQVVYSCCIYSCTGLQAENRSCRGCLALILVTHKATESTWYPSSSMVDRRLLRATSTSKVPHGPWAMGHGPCTAPVRSTSTCRTRTFFNLISPKFLQLRKGLQPPSPTPRRAISSPAASPLPPSRCGRGVPRRARRSTRRLPRPARERGSEEQTSEKGHPHGNCCLGEPVSPTSAGAQCYDA